MTELEQPQEILAWAMHTYAGRFAISTSFQAEGMVLVDMAARISPQIRVLTLDTGRLPAETYQMMETVRTRYGIPVEVIYPDATELESMVTRHGPDLFYRDVALRRLCCHLRKVRPLNRKLQDLDAYAVGLRREQGGSRADVRKIDDSTKPVKLSPLADWTRQQVDEYVRRHDVPQHPLSAKGYASIGCAPCTRAIEPGEDERAGRWWWEQDAAKECGLHFTPEGKAQRTVDILIEEVLAR